MGLHGGVRLWVRCALLCCLISNPSSTMNQVYNLGNDLASLGLGCLHFQMG